MNTHEELLNLNYVAYDHVTDFAERTNSEGLLDPELDLGFHYEEDTPVLDVIARGITGEVYTHKYVLEGLSAEAFEDMGYDIWTHSFEDSFISVNQIGRYLEE